jgi:hypothetical protein
MTSIYTNVLSDEEMNYLNNLPEVLAAKVSLDSKLSGMVYFSVPITDSIRNTLQSRFGLDLSTLTSIPMRWIKGDTIPHIDTGASNFQNTYLVYLNNSPGKLIVDSNSYPIKANYGFVFNEGLPHETQNTENVPRLLLGPMNEFAEPVGIPVPCFLEGSTILCLVNNKDVYIPIENIRKGMLVKTMNYSYIPVELIGYSIVNNTSDSPVLYRCKKENYPELKEDLIITEYHAILVDHLTPVQKEKTIKILKDIYVTDKKYRLIASIDERAEPMTKPGKHTVWHIALQNNNIYNNYGIYANGGLLVESISLRYLKEKSNMTLV